MKTKIVKVIMSLMLSLFLLSCQKTLEYKVLFPVGADMTTITNIPSTYTIKFDKSFEGYSGYLPGKSYLNKTFRILFIAEKDQKIKLYLVERQNNDEKIIKTLKELSYGEEYTVSYDHFRFCNTSFILNEIAKEDMVLYLKI